MAPDYDVAARARLECQFGPDTLTIDSVGSGAPAIPSSLKHVIIVMRENHSFDQYLSSYVGDPHQAVNPDPDTGAMVSQFHESRYCITDADHEWSAAHLQYDNGRLDGFVASANDTDGTGSALKNEGGGGRVMGYYDGTDLPLYYWLASNFAISDRYFCSLLGPTHANLMFYYRATSCDIAEGFDTNLNLTECGNIHYPDFETLGTGPSIFDRLNGGSFKIYTAASPAQLSAAVALGVASPFSVSSLDDFEEDVAHDDLPDLAFVEPDYGDSFAKENDEHPPHDIQDGQALTYRIVSAVMSNPSVWNSTVMFLTWDENGGFYDHVVPPRACPPDLNYQTRDYAFDNYGFRVPFIVVSPFAKQGYVSHYNADHTSILRFIEHWKHTGAMTMRDANAWPLLDMFDFSAPRVVPMPDPMMATVSTDPSHVATCDAHGGTGAP
ncbi:MAG: alkaline phosphatase family protein [Kofleriaceae bacterium]